MADRLKFGLFVTTTICIVIYMFTNLYLSNDLIVYKTENTLTLNMVQEKRDLLVIGILSHSDNLCLRNAQRRTLIPRAKAYKALDVRMYFVLDEETPKISAEQKTHNDIVFLNSTVHGYNRWFGVKLYIWLKYVMTNFPNVSMLGRMDDDAFVCAPQIFDRLSNVKNDLLYYGYPTGSVAVCPTQDCVDDMFIIIGRTLAKRVLDRPLCETGRNLTNCLYNWEFGTGAHEFRNWTLQYKDIYHVNERRNNRMIWYYGGTSRDEIRVWRAFRTWNFCRKYLLFHKATAEDIYKMDIENNNQLDFGFKNDETVRETDIIANCSLPLR